LLDGTIQVTEEEAYDFTRKAASMEGIFAGISTGATMAAIAKKIPALPYGSKILGINYDTGERYLSVNELF